MNPKKFKPISELNIIYIEIIYFISHFEYNRVAKFNFKMYDDDEVLEFV